MRRPSVVGPADAADRSDGDTLAARPSRRRHGPPTAAGAGILAPVLALLAAVAGPAPLPAQQPSAPGGGSDLRPLSVEAAGGIALPEGDLADWTDRGTHWALGVGYQLHPRIGMRLEGTLSDLRPSGATGPGDPATGPSAKLWTGSAMVAVQLAEPTGPDGRLTPWSVVLEAGGGLARWELDFAGTEPGTIPADDSVGSSTDPAIVLGARTGYRATQMLTLFFQLRTHLVLADASDPGDFLGKEYVLAPVVGARLRF